MATLDDSIRQPVQAYLARTGMNERKPGAFATGDPSLVPRLVAGGSTTLNTADALLRYMVEPPIGPEFASEVEAFLTETGIGDRQFRSRAAGDPSFVTKLRNGAGLRLYTVKRVRAWMRVNKRALMAELQSGTGKRSPTSYPAECRGERQLKPEATCDVPLLRLRLEHANHTHEIALSGCRPGRSC